MRITPGAQSMQMLKAQQAWEARRAMKSAEAPQTVPVTQPEQELQRPALPDGPMPGMPQWNRTVQEVQDIAQQAGFVGVTEQDIRRAYTYGESLLADYRV
jgi:hypothetical protein